MLHLYIVPSDDEWPLMSWCEDCEEARLEDKGWYDKADAMAKWSIICGRCFEVVVTSSKSLTEYPPEETPS
jgi:hypothetical protein